MKRNCNLELRLERPPVFPHPPDYDGHFRNMMENKEGGNPGDKQQLTIFYNGKVAVCDATELQARAILWLASREADEKLNESPGSDPPSPLLAPSLYSPTTGLKSSLKRFLQTRKSRVQATSPYPVTRN